MKLFDNSMMGKMVKRRGMSIFSAGKRSGGSKETDYVPEDVREGYFAVVAVKGEEKKRFIVKLEYLSDPEFLILLEQAKEEYGFGQKGALSVPCTPQELQRIMDNPRRRVLSATPTLRVRVRCT